MRQAQWSDEDIENVKSDADLIRHADREIQREAKQKAGHQASVEKLKAQYESQGQRPEAEGKRDKAPEGGESRTETGVEAPRGLPETVLDALDLEDSHRRDLGAWAKDVEKRANVSVKAAREAAEKAVESVTKRADDASKLAAKSYSMLEAFVLRSVQSELSADYPALATPATWQKVYDRAKKLAPGYAGEDLADSMRRVVKDAAYLELGPPKAKKPVKKPAQAADAEEPAKKPLQREQRPGRKRKSERRLTPEQRTERNAADAVRKFKLDASGRPSRW